MLWYTWIVSAIFAKKSNACTSLWLFCDILQFRVPFSLFAQTDARHTCGLCQSVAKCWDSRIMSSILCPIFACALHTLKYLHSTFSSHVSRVLGMGFLICQHCPCEFTSDPYLPDSHCSVTCIMIAIQAHVPHFQARHIRMALAPSHSVCHVRIHFLEWCLLHSVPWRMSEIISFSWKIHYSGHVHHFQSPGRFQTYLDFF